MREKLPGHRQKTGKIVAESFAQNKKKRNNDKMNNSYKSNFQLVFA